MYSSIQNSSEETIFCFLSYCYMEIIEECVPWPQWVRRIQCEENEHDESWLLLRLSYKMPISTSPGTFILLLIWQYFCSVTKSLETELFQHEIVWSILDIFQLRFVDLPTRLKTSIRTQHCLQRCNLSGRWEFYWMTY